MHQRPPSVRLKIERAKEHIAYLKTAIGDFRQRNPYRAVFNGDTHRGWGTFVVRIDEDIPPLWGVIVGEVLHGLRTSLDNAWFEIGGRTKRDEFPFHENANGFKARFKGKEKGPIKAAVDILRRIESYKAGNPLWALSQLDNLNKHEAPILCLSRLGTFTVAVPGGGAEVEPFLESLEEGTMFFLPVIHGHEMDTEHQIPFEITFAEMEFAKGGAVIPTLENMASVTDSIVSAFITEGLVR